MTIDLDAALEAAKRPERVVRLCLRGDLKTEYDELREQLRAAEEKPTDSLNGNRDARELRGQIEAVREQMREASHPFKLRGLSKPEWRSLVAAHPPREGHDGDDVLGYNPVTFFDALIRACLTPKVTDAQWIKLQDTLTSGQYDELAGAAIAVSQQPVNVPKSLPASVETRS